MLTHLYDYHDSFYHYRLEAGCRSHPQWLFMYVVGRPIYNFLEGNLTEAILRTPADAVKVRLIGLALLAVSCSCVYRGLRKQQMDRLFAILPSAGIFSLPGLLVGINMTSDAVNNFAVLLSVLAAYSLTKRSLFLGMCSTLVLLIALLMNQQLAPLFFCAIAISVIFVTDAIEGRYRIAAGTAAFGVAGLTYLAIHSFVLLPYVRTVVSKPLATRFPDTMQQMAIKSAPLTAVDNVMANSPRIFSLWFMNASDLAWVVFVALFIFSQFGSRQPHRLRPRGDPCYP